MRNNFPLTMNRIHDYLLFWKFILLGLCIGPNATAQTLTGTVTDAETSEPLPFTSVYLSNTTYATDSDTTGAYTLAGIPAGRYTLAVRVVGYTPYYQTTRPSRCKRTSTPAST